MAKNVIQYSWGISRESDRGIEVINRKIITSQGSCEIYPHQMIKLHPHVENNEEYTALSTGLHIIVISQEDAKNLSDADVLNLLKKQKKMIIGQTVLCPAGCCHALYNSSTVTGFFKFCKYRDISR